ncbi:MAG: hypothetical protein JWO96_80 [Candidatus Saccharibacteria bacterium]|nr:hypothetical protein [Candidatus Saccharibacteria bacterium]
MSIRRNAVCAAVTCCVLLTYGGQSGFATGPVVGEATPSDPPVSVTQPDQIPAPVTDDPPRHIVGSSIVRHYVLPVQTQPAAQVGVSFEARAKAVRWLSGKIASYLRTSMNWAAVMGATIRPPKVRHLSSMSVPRLKREAVMWKHIAALTRFRAQHPPHLKQFLCIHHYEGSWTDTGAPYYGGLQMDRSFQQTYAPRLYQAKGTANYWSPLEQIWAAEKALKSRGFGPWPNTARYCGLL